MSRPTLNGIIVMRVLFRVYDLENPRSFESRLNATRTMGAIDLPLPEEELTLR